MDLEALDRLLGPVGVEQDVREEEEHALLEVLAAVFLEAALPDEAPALLHQVVEATDIALQLKQLHQVFLKNFFTVNLGFRELGMVS